MHDPLRLKWWCPCVTSPKSGGMRTETTQAPALAQKMDALLFEIEHES